MLIKITILTDGYFYFQASIYGIIIIETARCVGFLCSSGGDSVSVFEALSLMIAFGTLIAVIVLSR